MNNTNLTDMLISYQQLQTALHDEHSGEFNANWQTLFGYKKVYLQVDTHLKASFSELKSQLNNKQVSGWLSLQDKNTLVKNKHFCDVITGDVLQGELCQDNSSWRFTRISEIDEQAQYHLVITTELAEPQSDSIGQIYLAKSVAHLAQQSQTLCYHKYYRITADGGVRPFHARLIKVENTAATGSNS